MNPSSTLSFMDILVLSGIIALWTGTFVLLKATFSRGKDEEIRRLRKENMDLREELRKREKELRQHYEALLRDAAIKNAMMLALWNAYKTGELGKCYEEGGYIKVLADGTAICWKSDEDKSYVIKSECKEPELKFYVPEEAAEGEEE